MLVAFSLGFSVMADATKLAKKVRGKWYQRAVCFLAVNFNCRSLIGQKLFLTSVLATSSSLIVRAHSMRSQQKGFAEVTRQAS